MNQLQRQALYQNHKLGVAERMYDGFTQSATSPVTSNHAATGVSTAAGYTFLSVSLSNLINIINISL